MRRLRTASILVLFLTWIVPAVADEPAYVCVADAAAGFKYENDQWRSVFFRTEYSKHLVSRNNSTGAAIERFSVGEFGSSFPFMCEALGHMLHCGSSISRYVINTKTLRYLYVYLAGFIHGDSYDDTPYIDRGRCSPL